MKTKIIGGWAVLALLLGAVFCPQSVQASVGDSDVLLSMTVASNAVIAGRTIFTQTWTLWNNGTNTWTPTANGYTLNMISWDTMGALELYTNTVAKRYDPTAIIGSGKSIPPGGTATFSMMFIAPEAAGTYTDTFQLNSASSVYFGPQIKVQIVVPPHSGSTLQFDRSMAISYANNYAGFVCSDGYFWTNGSDYYQYGTNVGVPTAFLGDDCAHFVSCCIGSEPHQHGAGLYIPSRTATYGEPGAARLVNTVLLGGCYAVEVKSLSQMMPGDVIGWNWEGDTNVEDLDHVTLYLGNGLLASHAESCLDCSATTFFQSGEPQWVWHLIHILDSPTVKYTRSGSNLIMSWTTNWSRYSLQSSTNPVLNASWTTVAGTPGKSGTNLTFSFTTRSSAPAVFYRLMMPGN